MNPLAIRPAPHFIPWLEWPAASRADLARRMCLVVVMRLRRELIRAGLMFFGRDAELLQPAFFDLGAPEVRRSCHHVPLSLVKGEVTAAVTVTDNAA